MQKTFTILALAAALSGCAGMVNRNKAMEQEAVSVAISLCKQFGHPEGSVQFTRCAEQRYNEVMVRRQR